MKYLIQKSKSRPDWWVVTDTENQVVCEFRNGDYNGTQKFTLLRDDSEYDVAQLPKIAADLADWLR